MALYFFLANTPTTQQFSLLFRNVALVCSLGSPVYTFHSPTKHRHDPHQWRFISSADDTTILTSFQACGACMPPSQPQRFPFRSLPLLPPARPRFPIVSFLVALVDPPSNACPSCGSGSSQFPPSPERRTALRWSSGAGSWSHFLVLGAIL